MTVRQDIWGDDALWLFVDDDEALAIENQNAPNWEGYFEEHEGQLERVGLDDRGLTFDEAMYIADAYEGGEFDNESAALVAVMVILREQVRHQARVLDAVRSLQ